MKTEGGAENPRPVWLAIRELKESFGAYRAALPRLIEVARSLERTLEHTRHVYNNAIKQRDEAHAKLTALQKPLGEVERVVSQYASVSEPVVASDGFTYENVSILDYIKECARTNTKAYSQLTKEELRDVVVPNQTLSRLVSILQKVHPPEVPPLTERFPIPPLATQQGDVNWKGTSYQSNDDSSGFNALEEDANGTATSICVAELEATLVNAVHVGSLNASQCSNNATTVNNISVNAHGRRWEARQQQQQQQGGGHSGKSNRKHPCLRVYGRCNFLNDCAFANYPYEACLNHIKGKCRFGRSCKEMHVNPSDHRYAAHRKGGAILANNNNTAAPTAATVATVAANKNNSAAAPAEAPAQKDEKIIGAGGRRGGREKDGSKSSSVRREVNSRDGAEEEREAKNTSTETAASELVPQSAKNTSEISEAA